LDFNPKNEKTPEIIDQGKMVCPACGYEQDISPECLKCGIIISKFNKQPDRRNQYTKNQQDIVQNIKPSHIPIKSAVIVLCSFVFIVFSAFNWWTSRPVYYGPGAVASMPPEQTDTETPQFSFNDFRVTPLADFHVNARVLSKEKYSFGRDADLVPIDLALGWGPMSDEKVLDKLKIRQSNRFYFWSTKQFPIPKKDIETHSANMHLISSNSTVLSAIKDVRVGNVVDFSGYLVRVQAEDGWRWGSSLSRDDTGNGACELVYVEEFEIQ